MKFTRTYARFAGFLCSVLLLLLTLGGAAALQTLPLHIQEVSIGGAIIYPDNVTEAPQAATGDHVPVTVWFTTSRTLDDLSLEAFFSDGTSQSEGNAVVATFDRIIGNDTIWSNGSYSRSFFIQVPEGLRSGNDTLTLFFSTENGTYVRSYAVEVTKPDHGLEVKDIVISPEGATKGGRTIAVQAELHNFGRYAENAKISARIQALGIKAEDAATFIEPAHTGFSKTIYLAIPPCAAAGTYELRGMVEYADGLKRDVFTHEVSVAASPDCASPAATDAADSGEQGTYDNPDEKTLITLPAPQDARQGGGEAVYDILIENQGASARSYYLEISGLDWASYAITPSNLVVIKPGTSVTVAISLAARDSAAVGTHSFTVNVKSGDTTIQQLSLSANVVSDSSNIPDSGALGGITANVIKRSPTQRIDLRGIAQVVTTLLIAITVIVLAVLYVSTREERPAPPKMKEKPSGFYYDKIYEEME